MNIKNFGKLFILLCGVALSHVQALPFDGNLTLWDDESGAVIENVQITGDADLENGALVIDPVVVDGDLMTFTSSQIYQTGPQTIFSNLDSAVISSGQVGARMRVNWRGRGRTILNVFSSFEAASGTIYYPVILSGGSTPGGLIIPGERVAVYIQGISSLGKVGIDVIGGNEHECLVNGGNNVSFNAAYEITGNATSAVVDWKVDGVYVGTGDDMTTFLTLGSYQITAEIIPNTGFKKIVSTLVSIVDTVRPTVVASFKLNGMVIDTIPAATMGDVEVSVEATDVCDIEPVVSPDVTLTQVHMIPTGGVLPIRANGDRVELATTSIKMIGSAYDASGNSGSSSAVLNIEY